MIELTNMGVGLSMMDLEGSHVHDGSHRVIYQQQLSNTRIQMTIFSEYDGLSRGGELFCTTNSIVNASGAFRSRNHSTTASFGVVPHYSFSTDPMVYDFFLSLSRTCTRIPIILCTTVHNPLAASWSQLSSSLFFDWLVCGLFH